MGEQLRYHLNKAAALVFILCVVGCIYLIGLAFFTPSIASGAKIAITVFFGLIAITAGFLLKETIRFLRHRNTGWGMPLIGLCVFLGGAGAVIQIFL